MRNLRSQLISNTNATSTNDAEIFQGNIFVLKIPNNTVQETPQLSPLWISLTTLSHTPTTRATSPAATRTTLLRWRLAAREPAVRGNARRSGPRSVPRESALMTPKRVILSSEAKMRRMDTVGGPPETTMRVSWLTATRLMSTRRTRARSWSGQSRPPCCDFNRTKPLAGHLAELPRLAGLEFDR